MANYEVIQGKVSKCVKIQVSDGMPAVSCLVGDKSVTVISAGLVPGIYDDDEVSIALVNIPRMGGKFGVAYYNKTRDQKYNLPTGQFLTLGWIFTIVGLATTPFLIGLIFLFQGIKSIKLSKAISAGAAALG